MNEKAKYNQIEKNVRIEILDVMKGIGIVSIVVGHAMNGSELNGGAAEYVRRFVYLYHLVVFVFVSGYFLKREDSFIKVLIKKLKTLYLPFVIWSVISCLLNFIFASLGLLSSAYADLSYLIKGIIKSVLFQNIGGFASPLWFLQLLFVSIMVFEMILSLTKVIQKEHIRSACIVAFSFIIGFLWAIVLMKVDFIGVSGVKGLVHRLHIDTALLMPPFLALGMLAREANVLHRLGIKKAFCVCGAGLVLLLLIVFGTDWEIELSRNAIISPVLFYIVSLIGIVFCVSCSALICKLGKKLKEALVFLGKGSLYVMAVHCIFLKLTDYVYGFATNASKESMSTFPVSFEQLRLVYVILAVVGSGLFVYCRNKIRIRKGVGK